MNRQIDVLVADDEGDMRQLLGLILKSHGYVDITYAFDGPNALLVLKQKDIHIAFIDINMPGENGISVVKQAQEIRPSCFCVMVSANSTVQNVRAALTAGARGFIVKPYTEQKIIQILKKFEAAKHI